MPWKASPVRSYCVLPIISQIISVVAVRVGWTRARGESVERRDGADDSEQLDAGQKAAAALGKKVSARLVRLVVVRPNQLFICLLCNFTGPIWCAKLNTATCFRTSRSIWSFSLIRSTLPGKFRLFLRLNIFFSRILSHVSTIDTYSTALRLWRDRTSSKFSRTTTWDSPLTWWAKISTNSTITLWWTPPTKNYWKRTFWRHKTLKGIVVVRLNSRATNNVYKFIIRSQ